MHTHGGRATLLKIQNPVHLEGQKIVSSRFVFKPKEAKEQAESLTQFLVGLPFPTPASAQVQAVF